MGVVDDRPETAAAVLDRILALVDERVEDDRAAAIRAFVREYMRRLADEVPDTSPEALFREVLGAFALASGRGGAPVAVRAFNPIATEHGYEPLGAVLETNTDDRPFLVDSVSAALERRGAQRRAASCTRSSASRATATGGSLAVTHPRDAARTASRSCTSTSTAGSPRASSRSSRTRCATVLARGARHASRDFGAMTAARRRDDRARARAAARATTPTRSREAADFLAWLLRGNFVLLGAREYEFATTGYRGRPRLRARHPRRRGALGVRRAGAARRAARERARSARRAATC